MAYTPRFSYGVSAPLNIDGSLRDCLLIEVAGDEYIRCEEASRWRWGNRKTGAYGNGLCATKDDRFRPARTGLLGEMGFAKLSGLPVDLDYHENGDIADFMICGNKCDLKTALRRQTEGLVYCRNEWGKERPLDKEIYIFGYLTVDDRIRKVARIIFVGWVTRSTVAACPVCPGKLGHGHHNYVVPYAIMQPIKELLMR